MPVEEKLSNQDMVRKFLENAATQVTDGSAEIVKAPRFSLAMLVSLETLVADFKMPKALRVLAWARLVKVYGALRADDMQRIRPAAVELNEGGLVATLCRTKTSGPGKALLHLKLFIPVEAYVSNPLWLAAGHALWVEDARSQKDFLPVLEVTFRALRIEERHGWDDDAVVAGTSSAEEGWGTGCRRGMGQR